MIYAEYNGEEKCFNTKQNALDFIWGDICSQMRDYFDYSYIEPYDEHYYYYHECTHGEADAERYEYWNDVRTFSEYEDRYTKEIDRLVSDAFDELYEPYITIIQETKKMPEDELSVILENHKHWLKKDCDGWEDMQADLRGADLQNRSLAYADLRFAELKDAYLKGADLTGARLDYACLRNAELSDAKLNFADLHNADLTDAFLDGSSLYLANLRGANLKNSDLSKADMQCADLRKANLYNALLLDTDLKGAHLKGADLTDADLTGADLKDADLTGVVNLGDSVSASSSSEKVECDKKTKDRLAQLQSEIDLDIPEDGTFEYECAD